MRNKVKPSEKVIYSGFRAMGRGIYRSALEGLSSQLRMALQILTGATGLQAKMIRVVGGVVLKTTFGTKYELT